MNTPEDFKIQISECLGVSVADNPGTYLGVPSMWGKAKSTAKAFLIDRYQGRMQHWKQHLLSQGGKKILLKAIVFLLCNIKGQSGINWSNKYK